MCGEKAIEIILQALEKITEERNDYRSQLNGAFDNGFIPKKKIEDKIKEYERVNKERGYLLVRESFVKKELQELLEDK